MRKTLISAAAAAIIGLEHQSKQGQEQSFSVHRLMISPTL